LLAARGLEFLERFVRGLGSLDRFFDGCGLETAETLQSPLGLKTLCLPCLVRGLSGSLFVEETLLEGIEFFLAFAGRDDDLSEESMLE